MHIIKQFQTDVNLSATDTYSSDLDDVVMQKLRTMFENKCYKSSLVIRILRIIERSLWKPSQNLANGSGYVSVTFEVEAVIYNLGDIIVDCTVQTKVRGGGLLCKSDHATIHIKGAVNIRGIKVGQQIPIKIEGAKYFPRKNNISVNATPYYCPFNFTLYSTDLSKINKEDVEVLERMYAQYKETQTKFNDLNGKVRDFFLETFYPFTQKYDKFKKEKQQHVKAVDLDDEIKRVLSGPDAKEAPMYVFRHPKTDKSDGVFYHMDTKVLEGKVPNIPLLNPKQFGIRGANKNYATILISYLEKRISYMNMIVELSETFSTEESRRKQKEVWSIYNNAKR